MSFFSANRVANGIVKQEETKRHKIQRTGERRGERREERRRKRGESGEKRKGNETEETTAYHATTMSFFSTKCIITTIYKGEEKRGEDIMSITTQHNNTQNKIMHLNMNNMNMNMNMK